MGTNVNLEVHGGRTRAFDQAIDLLEELEQRWSRFRPDSDISRINRADGTAIVVDPLTIDLLHRAQELWSWSGGLIDPTIGRQLARCGYDRNWRREDRSRRGRLGCVPASTGLRDLVLDPIDSTVTLPTGTQLDLGGVGKGRAADLVAQSLIQQSPVGVLVDLGGDIRTLGHPLDSPFWRLSIRHPGVPSPGTVLANDAAVVTSTTRIRTWTTLDGGSAHHLIDPRSGQPARQDIESATVIARDAMTAEAAAKVAIIDGRRGFDWLCSQGIAVLATTNSNGTLGSPIFVDHLDPHESRWEMQT